MGLAYDSYSTQGGAVPVRLPLARKATDEELMAATGIKKTEYFTTHAQLDAMRRKIIGSSWGKKRRKYTGP